MPEFCILDQKAKCLGLKLLYCQVKENLLTPKEKKKIRSLNRTTMLFEHQRIITKQHGDELNINESGTCGFNFLPNTHICRFKEKCPIFFFRFYFFQVLLSCNPLKDGKRITEPEWALTLLPETGPLEYDFTTSPHFLCKLYLLPSRA